VEIISGMEEARLIFVGVSHYVPAQGESMLVLDIGGGSTELIIGEGHEPKLLESLFMGCVAWSRRYFAGEKLSKKRFDRARLAARLELRPVAEVFRRRGWGLAIGSSGTIRAAVRTARALGFCDTALTVDALESLIGEICAAGSVGELKLPELNQERAPVFAGGVAILVETMKELGVEELHVSDGALREGLLYDMLGRLQNEDARDRTIRAIQGRYNVDQSQAARVEESALLLLRAVRKDWGLKGPEPRRYLAWASQLHEVGLDIAHTKYHQHGGYLIANAYLPGFVSFDQLILSTLVAHHRRKIEGLDTKKLPESWQKKLPRLLVLFRLAVLLNRSRSSTDLPELNIRAKGDKLGIDFPIDWLDNNRLTKADLEQEVEWSKPTGVRLLVASVDED
jgi:exopolyphosphatase/guanosine-5'-triphosphate,3'-diphosphate pyrophosphatase